MGCSGVLAGVGTLAAVGLGITFFVVQQQLDEAAHWALDTYTGGELDFRSARPDWSGIRLQDVRLTSGEEVLLTAESALLAGDFWAMARGELDLEGLHLAGVEVHLVREGDTLLVPQRLSGLLRGEGTTGLPEVGLPELTVADARVHVGDVVADLHDLRVTGQRLAVLPKLDTDDLVVEVAGIAVEHLELENVRATLLGGDLVRPVWTLRDVQVGRLAAHPDGRAWAVEQALDDALAGLWVPAFRVEETTFEALEVGPIVGQGALSALSGGGDGEVLLEGLEAQDLRMPGVAFRYVAVERAVWLPGEPTRLRASVNGVQLALKKQPGLGLPSGLTGLTRGLRLDLSATVENIEGRLTSGEHDLAFRADVADIRGIDLASSFSFQSGEARAVVVRGDERLADIGRVKASADGTLEAEQATFFATATAAHHLDLPPLLMEHVPDWAGGSASGEWGGVALRGLPWTPKRLVMVDGTLALRDEALVEPSVDWSVGIESLTASLAGGELQVRATTRLAEGTLVVDGRVDRGLGVRGTIGAEALRLPYFQPYAAKHLAPSGTQLGGGTVDLAGPVELKGAQLTADLATDVHEVHLIGKNAAGRLVARAATTMPELEVEVKLAGDLSDPDYSPTRQVVKAMVVGVLNQLDATAEAKEVATKGAELVGRTGEALVGQGEEAVGRGREAAQDVGERARDTVRGLGGRLGLGKGKKGRQPKED